MWSKWLFAGFYSIHHIVLSSLTLWSHVFVDRSFRNYMFMSSLITSLLNEYLQQYFCNRHTYMYICRSNPDVALLSSLLFPYSKILYANLLLPHVKCMCSWNHPQQFRISLFSTNVENNNFKNWWMITCRYMYACTGIHTHVHM